MEIHRQASLHGESERGQIKKRLHERWSQRAVEQGSLDSATKTKRQNSGVAELKVRDVKTCKDWNDEASLGIKGNSW